jgi:hypothetical protein
VALKHLAIALEATLDQYTTKWVLVVLADMAGGDGIVRSQIRDIADRACCSSTTVRKHLDQLADYGMLTEQRDLDQIKLDLEGVKGPELQMRKEEQEFDIPYDLITSVWNSVADDISYGSRSFRITDAGTPRRRKHLRSRWRDGHFPEHWYETFQLLPKCTEWIRGFPGFSFDWIIKAEDNYRKVAEGKFLDEDQQDDYKWSHEE